MPSVALISKRVIVVLFIALAVSSSTNLAAQTPAPAPVASHEKPETVEWVYRVQYGHGDEWFRIFKKYQIAILEKQKQLGYVKDFEVWAPSLHTSEDARWDYRVVITRAAHDAPPGQSEDEVALQLFPDQETFKREENRRWELTTNHWDLPIHSVDLDSSK